MTTQPQPGHVSLDSSTQPARVRAIGDWTLAHYTALEREVTRLRSEVAANVSFDLSQLGALDTAGAALQGYGGMGIAAAGNWVKISSQARDD